MRPLVGSYDRSIRLERFALNLVGVICILHEYGLIDGRKNVNKRRLSQKLYSEEEDYRSKRWPKTWLLLLDGYPAAFTNGKIPGVRVVD